MPPRRRAFTPGPGKQRGQALLFVTVTALVMLLAMLTMFSMGQLTTEKMKLQNTADAAAYSAAIAQARDYNFSAYLNRGMIANDVAVAQLVGLASWGRNYYDTFHTLMPRVDSRYSWVSPGPLYSLWSVSEPVAKGASSTLKPAFDTAARMFVPLLLTINEGFASSQKIYHYGTALTVAQTLGVDDKFNSIMQGAFGFDLSKITEYISWGSCPTSTDADNVDTSNCYNVVKLNDRSAHLSLLGMAGYADNTSQWLKFTSERNPLGPWGTETRVDGVSCRPGEEYFVGICWSYLAQAHYPEQVITTQTHPEDPTTDDGPKKDRMAGVVNASLDDFTKDRSRTWWLPMLVDPILLVGPEPSAGWFLKMLFHDGATKLADDKDANGFRKEDSWNQRWVGQDSTNMLAIATVPVGPIPFWGFINIPVVPLMSGKGAWDLLGADATGTASAGPDSGDLSKLTALRSYRDVTNIEQATTTANQNISSPPLLVEVEKRTNTITTSATGRLRIGRSDGAADPAGCGIGDAARNAPQVTAPFGSGNLDVGDGAAANCMRALSKAEAYFSRPADLFPRADHLTEYGSLYSPYWQARLLPNSSDEQSASLILHGLTDFKSFGAGASSYVAELIRQAK